MNTRDNFRHELAAKIGTNPNCVLDACLSWDRDEGEWPEDRYQGRAFLFYLCEYTGVTPPQIAEDSDNSTVWWENLIKTAIVSTTD